MLCKHAFALINEHKALLAINPLPFQGMPPESEADTVVASNVSNQKQTEPSMDISTLPDNHPNPLDQGR